MGLRTLLKRRKQAQVPFVWKPAVMREPQECLWEGRRHLVGVPYLLPKDPPEAHRLDFQHHLLRALLGAHYCAPLKRSTRDMLDVGCGTGRWTHDMARAFPHAQVIAFDLEPPPPAPCALPANYRFVRGDLFAGLPFEERSFDYVHQRLMVAAIPRTQWPLVVRELIRVTRLQGYLELLEAGDSYLNAGTEMQRFLQWGREIAGVRGIDLALVTQLDELLLEAGMKQAQKRVLQAPVGQWGGRIGDLLARNMLAAFASFKGPYCQTLALPPEQFEATLSALPQEWNERRTVLQLYVFYGQR